MFSHVQALLIQTQKDFLVFLESILFLQKLKKISKIVLPCFGDSVAGHPSRMLQPRARVLILATCSRVKGPVARGTQRFSRG